MRLTKKDRRFLIELLSRTMEQNMDTFSEKEFDDIEDIIQKLFTPELRREVLER